MAYNNQVMIAFSLTIVYNNSNEKEKAKMAALGGRVHLCDPMLPILPVHNVCPLILTTRQ